MPFSHSKPLWFNPMPSPYFESDSVTIYHGSWETILPELPKAELILADPPYVMDVGSGSKNSIGGTRQYQKDIQGFTDAGFDDAVLDYADNWVCFCSKAQLIGLLEKADKTRPRWMLVTWNKPNPSPLSAGNYLPDTEYIVHAFQSGRCFGSYRDKSRYILHPTRQGLLHPNEKPLPVVRKMISVASKEGDLVIDPFAGSGTTGLAAKLEGRRAILIEKLEKYCEKSARRMEQGVLF